MTKQQDTRIDPRTLAVLIADPVGTHALALGRKVNDKRVRSVARDTIDRFINRTGYTAHAYTVAEATAIVDAMRSAGRGAPTATADDARAMLTGKAAPKRAPKRAPRSSSKASKGATAPAPAPDVDR